MKTYTIISVIIFATTLVATLLGLKLAGTPIVDSVYGFSLLLIVEAAVAILMLAVFRWKKWF